MATPTLARGSFDVGLHQRFVGHAGDQHHHRLFGVCAGLGGFAQFGCGRFCAGGCLQRRGADGLVGFTADGSVEVPGMKVDVADTVGAGDTVGAVLVEAIVKNGLNKLTGEVLKTMLNRAVKAAAITVSRTGANPPSKEEID